MKKITVGLISFFIFLFNVCAQDIVNVTLDKCIDGDTARIIIDGEVKKVRFLSINAPEVEHDDKAGEPFGDEASKYTCKLLNNASNIYLEFDENSNEYDKYGRLLAWVFVDDELLQEKIIKKGLAKVDYVYGDYKYTSKLKKEQDKAKSKKIGMWDNASNYFPEYYLYIIVLMGVLLIIHFLRKLWILKMRFF